MYLLENAFYNVKKNRGRNLLIGAVILTVIVTSVVSLMINNTASGIIDEYKSRFGSEVRLEPNMEKIRDEAMKNSTDGKVRVTLPSIPPEQYMLFGESAHLKESIYTANTGVACDEITSIDAEKGGGSGQLMVMGGGPASETKAFEAMFSLQGNSYAEFEHGTRELTEGSRYPDGLNECIISTDLAELNGLEIGGRFSFTGQLTNREAGLEQEISYTLTIVGTYDDITNEYAEGGMQNAYTNRRNEILTSYETVVSQMTDGFRGISVNATYYLKHPELLDAFSAELYKKGLAKTFDVTTDEDSYNKIVGPVEGLKGIAVTFMMVVLLFGGIIIALLSSIAIRERKYEIGVLRAMGLKKHKVAFSLWAETVIITMLCLLLGLGIGSIAAQPVTNSLLAGQIAAAEESSELQPQQSAGMFMIKPPSMTTAVDAEPLRNLDISLDVKTMLEIAAIALLLSTFAGLISILRITKYEPIKILMERN